jgi:hypothetical protein
VKVVAVRKVWLCFDTLHQFQLSGCLTPAFGLWYRVAKFSGGVNPKLNGFFYISERRFQHLAVSQATPPLQR